MGATCCSVVVWGGGLAVAVLAALDVVAVVAVAIDSSCLWRRDGSDSASRNASGGWEGRRTNPWPLREVVASQNAALGWACALERRIP